MDNVILHEHGRYRPVAPVPGAFPPGHPLPDDNWPYHGYPTTPLDREFGVKNPKIERHIFIRQDSIFYAIDAQLLILARARRQPDGTENEPMAMATKDFRPMFCQWIDDHIGEAKTAMAAFVLEHTKRSAINAMENNEEVDITLLMPHWYDDTTFKQLKSAINNYVVDATLYDYFMLALTEKDPVTLSKAVSKNNLLDEIKKLVNMSKPGAVKTKMNPF